MTKTKHFQLTFEKLNNMRDFINNTSLLYLILKLENPFCDRPIKIDPLDIAQNWNIPKSSVYRAILKLKQMGKINILKTDMVLEWTDSQKLDSIPNFDTDSQKLDSILKNETAFSEMRLDSQNCDPNSQFLENEALKPSTDKSSSSSHIIHTIHTIHTLSEDETQEKENCIINSQEIQNSQENRNTEKIPKTNNNTSDTTPITPKNTFTPVRSCSDNNGKGLVKVREALQQTSKVQLKAWEWLPDGDWKVDHKLDPNFHDWLANKWMTQYNKTDFFSAKADVLAYFQKAPERLPIRWEQYQQETSARIVSLQDKHNRGLNLSRQEQQFIAKHSNQSPSTQISEPSTKTIVLSDGQRTVYSNDYTNLSHKEPEIPVNPKATQMIKDWLQTMTGKKQHTSQHNQYQRLHNHNLQPNH